MKPESFYKILCGILLAIVGFIGTQIYIKISDMQHDVIEMKITLAKIQAEALTREDVREITLYEIQKYHSLKVD